MNILLVCETQRRGAGAESVLEYLLEAWTESGMQQQHPIHLLLPESSLLQQVATDLSVPFTVFSGVTGKLLQNMKGALRMKQEHPELLEWADIVHAWTARAFELALFLRQGSRRCTATLHDHPSAPFHGRIRRQIMKQTSRRMDAVACVSQAVKQACETQGYSVHMDVVQNGIPDRTQPDNVQEEPGPLRVGFLGLYTDWKGFELICSWIREFSTQLVVWNLYGEPTARNLELLEGLPGNVRVRGFVPSADIWREIDVLVHASPEFDPFPTVVLEAGEAGVPAIASCLGGAGEIVQPGVTGHLHNPNVPGEGKQQLAALIQDRGRLEAMGKEARKIYLSRFTSIHMMERYLRFWSGVLEQRNT